ncbi:MAG: hypothetical protein OEQ53_00035 [Saprospiraceae bacterium]|nr:hypothetical protein [Saprospiraceae bacterium]
MMKKTLFWTLRATILVILPFMVLIRGSVYLHEHMNVFPRLALFGGVALTFVLLFIYFTFFYGRLTGEWGSVGSFRRRAIILVLFIAAYCGYALFYVSGSNVKSPEIAREFRNLHPILRLGISTVIFLDPTLLITDADRLPEDYDKMGLQRKSQSLHYRQDDGYVHAVDIRTNGRSALRNWFLKVYFKSMGFNVLRHVGTADHLHISLQSRNIPSAI